MNIPDIIIGYAIVPKGEDKLCFTSDAVIGATVWQIYKTRRDAKQWLKLKFADAEYEIVPVTIMKR